MIGTLCGAHVPSHVTGLRTGQVDLARVMSMMGEGPMGAPAVLVYRDWCANKEAVGKLLDVHSGLRAMAEQ